MGMGMAQLGFTLLALQLAAESGLSSPITIIHFGPSSFQLLFFRNNATKLIYKSYTIIFLCTLINLFVFLKLRANVLTAIFFLVKKLTAVLTNYMYAIHWLQVLMLRLGLLGACARCTLVQDPIIKLGLIIIKSTIVYSYIIKVSVL